MAKDQEPYKTRVTFFLPQNTPQEEKAIRAIVDYLKKQQENTTIPVTGFTYSMLNDPVFTGEWFWKGSWRPERVVLFRCGLCTFFR